MATKVFIIAVIAIYILFLLSALGPVRSKRRFWKVIYKVRAGMDFASYWFFNICAIATVVLIIILAFNGALKR